MLSAAIIVFRETLEAALIIGIIAAATRGIDGRGRWLSGGLLAGVAGSLLVAALTERIAQLAEGAGQELFNAGILGVAVVMLAWHNIWMAQHGRELAQSARAVGTSVRDGRQTLAAVGVVIALAVLREGSETALFLYGLLAAGESSPATVLAGGGVGLTAGALCGFALYAGFLRIPARAFFAATSGLILLLAAAMASQMARFLVQADLLPSLASPVWDTSAVLPNNSTLGTLLHALAGYEATPSGMQCVFYVLTFVVILYGMRLARPRAPGFSPVTSTS
jgi:high-affinity iron transporter